MESRQYLIDNYPKSKNTRKLPVGFAYETIAKFELPQIGMKNIRHR